MSYCMTFLHGWRTVRHERFESQIPLPPGFVLVIRCQICGEYMSLGDANDRVPNDEMRMAESLARQESP